MNWDEIQSLIVSGLYAEARARFDEFVALRNHQMQRAYERAELMRQALLHAMSLGYSSDVLDAALRDE